MISPIFLAAALLSWVVHRWHRKFRYLPGPRGFPIIGNVFDVPNGANILSGFADLASKYGDVVHLQVFSQGLLVINSQKAAVEILGREGSSGRPPLTMATELSGYDRFMALMQNGEDLRYARRYLQRTISPQHARNFASAQEAEVVRYLKKLLNNPDGFDEHNKWIVGACILTIAYGYTPEEHDDPYIKSSSLVLDQFADAATPGRWLVDLVPFLKYLPTWFPGTEFKRLGALYRATATSAFEMPYHAIKQQMKDGIARKSLVASFLEENPNRPKREEELMMFIMADLYGGGLHSMTSLMSSFFLGMTMNQAAQRKAQAEIDSVCNAQSRLPTFSDKASFPYVEALVWEVLRFGAPVHLGLPHRFTETEVYEGMEIPKGTHAFANIGGISFDPASYPEPHLFKPERYIGENPQPDPRKTVFGFGRRGCPGVALAEQSLFIIILSTLATFNIRPRAGEVYSISRHSDGLISHNDDFACDIRVRSERSEDLICDNN